MAWVDQHGLAKRLATSPPLLAGPILRRVTPDAVTVWVATKYPYDVTLDVYSSDEAIGNPPFSGTLRTTALGTNLHVAAVTAVTAIGLIGKLAEGHLYFYDLTFTATDGSHKQLDLAQALALEGVAPVQVKSVLGYDTYDHPSFVLPPKALEHLRLLHGSCRKPHAEGRDALAIVDDLIGEKVSDPVGRPHQLLLTGDQIYADDVADGLLLMLSDAGETLLGWSETVALTTGQSPMSPAVWPSYARIRPLQDAGLTSDDLKSHLMALGEYLAMYLFAWSDALWPPQAEMPTFADISDWAVNVTGLPNGFAPAAQASIAKHKKAIVQELKYVTTFRSTLPSVRRALANIPTYMICDDHEITDDWNMTRRFCRDVYNSPLGRRVVQNGLLAFALCQAWGNAPERFTTTPVTAGGTLLSTLANLNNQPAASRPSLYEFSAASLKVLVGIHSGDDVLQAGRVFHDAGATPSATAENKASLRFDFRVEGPGHLIFVTDTRTWRAFPKTGLDTHPDLLPDPTQITAQLTAGAGSPLGSRQLIVVVTTNAPPIAGIRFATRHPLMIDTGGHPISALGAVYEEFSGPDTKGHYKDFTGETRAIYENDLLDSWELPGKQFDALIGHIATLLQAGSQTNAILLSGDVHSSFASRLLISAGGPGGAGSPPLTPKFVVAQMVSSPFKNQAEQTRGQQLEGYTYAPSEYARFLVPDHVPEAFAGPVLAGTSATTAYRLDYLVAQPSKPAGAVPNKLRVGDGEDTANLANYATMLKILGKDTYQGASPLQMIGHNNVAELTFAGTSALHTVHWLGPKGPALTTTYQVSLNPKDLSYKPMAPS